MVRYETTFEYGRLKNHDGLAFERASGLAAFLAAVSLMSSCSVGSRMSSTGKPPSSVNSVSPSYGVSEGEDSIRLQSLWNIRSSEDIDTNFPIGPGDVIEVNAQYMTELEGKKVRVAGDGTVDLPLIGVIHAAGLSEEALSALIVEKLRKYIYKPEVEVFVRSYHSHQVAVIGAVKKAGPITLANSQETILDMLKQAGGTTSDAGDAIVLFPNGAAVRGVPKVLQGAQLAQVNLGQPIDGQNDQASGDSKEPLSPQNLQPVIIPLHTNSLTYSSISLPAAGNYLQMPVRPGDLILVPGGGEAIVIGWVKTPGHFKVGPGLTVLEAIAGAGGPLFAADESDVRVIRTDPSGEKRIILVNVSDIRNGQVEDPPVFPNDIIDVPYSTAKIGPYTLYNILVNRVGIGFGGAIPFQ